jgi:hypothetical protein
MTDMNKILNKGKIYTNDEYYHKIMSEDKSEYWKIEGDYILEYNSDKNNSVILYYISYIINYYNMKYKIEGDFILIDNNGLSNW